MRDRFLLPLMVLTGVGMIALSMYWPQGQGALSPAPFGRPLAPLEPDEVAAPAPRLSALPGLTQGTPAKPAATAKPALLAPTKPADAKIPAAKTLTPKRPAKPTADKTAGLRPAQ